MTQMPLRSSFLALMLGFCLETNVSCQDRSAVKNQDEDVLSLGHGESLAIEDRGTETKRNIRRYLECKGRRCEDKYPEGAQAVEGRSSEFKDVWDTLANSENVLSPAEYAERLKPKKKSRR